MAKPMKKYNLSEFIRDMIIIFMFLLILYGMLCVMERYEKTPLPLNTEQGYNEKAKENLGRIWLCR